MSPRPRRIIVDISGRFFRNSYLNYLAKAFLNIVLIVLLLRWLDMAMYDDRWIVVVLALLFTAIEESVSIVVHRHYAKYILQTFGTVMILSIILSMSLAYFLVSDQLIFYTMDTFFGFIVLFMITRKVLSIVLMFYISQNRVHKLLEKEVRKDV